MLRYDETELLQTIERLPRQLRAAFAAACAQRMLIAYSKFTTRTGRGNPLALKEILNHLWRDLVENCMSDTEIVAAIDSCMKLIPEEGKDPYVPGQLVADDAPSAAVYALECHRSGSAQEAAWAAQCICETLEEHVMRQENISINTVDLDDRLFSHSLVQAELARQQRDLRELLSNTVTVDELRRRSENEATAVMS
jgi:uncharacterized protein YjaG (DUF416 family)